MWRDWRVLLFGFLGLVYCSTQQEGVRQPNKDIKIAEQEGWNSEILTSKNGYKTAIIRYGHMFKYANEKVFHFNEGVDVDFFNTVGEHVSHVKADSGVLKETSEDVEAHGNVVVVSDSGMIVHTDRLFWDSKSERVYSDAPVMVVRAKGDTLYGTGFESDKNLENYEFYQPHGVSDRKIDFDLDKRLRPRQKPGDSTSAETTTPPDTLP